MFSALGWGRGRRDRVNEAKTPLSANESDKANAMTGRSGEVKYRWLVQPGGRYE